MPELGLEGLEICQLEGPEGHTDNKEEGPEGVVEEVA